MRNFKGILSAILSSATFGLIPLFSLPLLAAGLPSPAIVFYRLALAAAMMGLAAAVLRRKLRISPADLGVLLLLSTLYAGTSFILLLSYNYIPSGVATTIHFLYPLVVTLVMTVLFRERRSIWLGIAVILSLAGVALLSWSDTGTDGSLKGVGIAAITVFTYAAYIIGVMKTRAARLDPVVVAFYVLSFGALYTLLFALATTGIPVITSWPLWRNLLLLALIPTVVSNLTLVTAIQSIGSTLTSILGCMEPLTAVLIGVLCFSEQFDATTAAGLLLVLTAVIVVILRAGRPKQHP